MKFLFRLFGASPVIEKTVKVVDEERFDRLDSRLRELRERVEQLESTHKALKDEQERFSRSMQLEWEETYDKVRHLMARITKRQKKSEPEEPVTEAAGDLVQTTSPVNGAVPLVGMHDRLQTMRARHGLLPR